MSLLHVHFNLREQQAFQRLLDSDLSHGGKRRTPSSGGKSWSRPSPLSSSHGRLDVNALDSLGRTVLHLVASATDPSATEYTRMLLAHPSININQCDKESRWSPLHRALYHGNIETALLLLRRPDININVKDREGHRPFDLYNSTVEGTNPGQNTSASKISKWQRMELFTWGSNRNATLGLGDADDRAFPDQVVIPRPDTSPTDLVELRFAPVRVSQVAMSKMRTTVITTASRGNLLACGSGSEGRLGSAASHTQFDLVPIPITLPPDAVIVSVALGQDHTLALTSAGEVYSWGRNSFSQLGYNVESSVSGSGSKEVQSTPRKVPGLKHQSVVGVAACKTASACWTQSDVWTWGTHSGQLGYVKSGRSAQITPRKVTGVSEPVLAVTITDSAMACLLKSHDVVYIWNGRQYKVSFPPQELPSNITPYRPPQAVRNTSIRKVTASDMTLAALSTNGELFTYDLPSPTEIISQDGRRVSSAKPRRVWALRKQYSAVKDVALGADGSAIICTESGHVFIRPRNPIPASSSSTFLSTPQSSLGGSKTASSKFQRVLLLQRVVKVCANSTGSFGAIRADADPGSLDIGSIGAIIQEDMKRLRAYSVSLAPHLGTDNADSTWEKNEGTSPISPAEHLPEVEDEDAEDSRIIFDDVQRINSLCDLLEREELSRQASGIPHGISQSDSSGRSTCLPHGADLMIRVQTGSEFPAHRLILAARCAVLHDIFSGSGPVSDKRNTISIKYAPTPGIPPLPLQGARGTLTFNKIHPLSLLILLEYLYTDEVLAVWDPRIAASLTTQLCTMNATPVGVRQDLLSLADALELPIFRLAVEAPVKRIPEPTMVNDFWQLIGNNPNSAEASLQRGPTAPDTILLLADGEVLCHSTILRARCSFFAAFFGDEVWTQDRWTPEGTVRVDFKHVKWGVMSFVVRYLYGGDVEVFDKIESVNSPEELADLMFEVMAVANELLLDRLVHQSSHIILKHLTVLNACSVLTDANHFQSVQLVERTQWYIARNLETMLEGHMLDDLAVDIVRQLSAFVRQAQLEKSPVSRSGVLALMLMKKHEDWLAVQDIPGAIQRTSSSSSVKLNQVLGDLAKLSPPGLPRWPEKQDSPSNSPAIKPQISVGPVPISTNECPDDGVFMMDDGDAAPSAFDRPVVMKGPMESPGRPSGGWKVSAAPKVDMKTIMAEAETNKSTVALRKRLTPPRKSNQLPGDSPNWRTSNKSFGGPGGTPERPNPLVTAPSSPWRSLPSPNIPTPGAPTPGTPASHSTQSPRSKGAKSTTTPKAEAPSARSKEPGPPRPPGMGPIFAPSKQTSARSSGAPAIRRVSSGGNVWSTPLQPAPPPTTQPSGIAMSFAAIQQLQQQQSVLPVQDKRSLKQIQEEEEASRAEAQFLKWWTAEEEKVKKGQALLEPSTPAAPNRQSKKSRGRGQSGRPNFRKETSEIAQSQEVDTNLNSGAAASSSNSRGGGTTGRGRKPKKPRGPTQSPKS